MLRIVRSDRLLVIRHCILVFGVMLLCAAIAVPQSVVPNPHCVDVGGMLMTNFLSESTTLGTATGDLKGAVSATIIAVTQVPGGTVNFRVQHNWTTESGDVIFFEPAEAVATPDGPGLFGVTYDHINIVGGTGKFEGATGMLKAFGGADLGRGQTVFRYNGQVCFKPPSKP